MLKKFLILDRKKQKMVLLLAGVVIIALGTLLGSALKGMYLTAETPQEDIQLEDKAEEVADTLKEIKVYISGAVDSPGVYTLTEGDRLIQVLELAKPRDDADVESLNLAQILSDENKITVPVKGESVPASSASEVSSASVQGNGKVNINSATASELETINGIGPQMAKKIISYRETNGRFTSLEDLINVSGIGEKTLAKITPDLTV